LRARGECGDLLEGVHQEHVFPLQLLTQNRTLIFEAGNDASAGNSPNQWPPRRCALIVVPRLMRFRRAS
jgi:hypothetical protein